MHRRDNAHAFDDPSTAPRRDGADAQARVGPEASASGEVSLHRALGRQFDCPVTDIFTARPTCLQPVHITRKVHARDGFGLTEARASAAAYLFGVDLGRGGRQIVTRGRSRGEHAYAPWSLGCRALDEDYAAQLLTPFDWGYLYVPKAVLDDVAHDQGHRLGALAQVTGAPDPMMASLVQALLPVLTQPDKTSWLFVDSLLTAALLHLAQRYGDLPVHDGRRGGLAHWQRVKAEEMLGDPAAPDVGLADLADACGLSRGYFVTAFKATYGVTPYQWRTQSRVARAKALIQDSTLTIAQIALQCGFVDQSHLTRVFSKHTGLGPARWRRLYRA